MLTLSYSTTDIFPFKIRDRVLIQWQIIHWTENNTY